MTADDWAEAYDPLDILAALSCVPDVGSLWEYVIRCLEGIGESPTANLIARRQAGEVDEDAILERQIVLAASSQRTSGGGYSMGRKPVRIPLATQRARAGLAALEPSPRVAAERVTQETRHQLQRLQCAWLRCLFPNPFHSISLDPSWLTSTVILLATGLHEEKAFDRMPILADALQDAGCENDDILNHCRQPGEHVKGCWCVDLLTGRE